MKDILNDKSFSCVESIRKGWSNDKKYYVETKSGEKLLLRVSDISEYEEKKHEFERMKRISAAGIKMLMPIDFGERPTALMHEDFQTDIMVISPDSELSVIDFQMCGAADQNLVMTGAGVSAMYSIPFAVGQIDGYFGNNVPDDFWKSMIAICLRKCSTLLRSE